MSDGTNGGGLTTAPQSSVIVSDKVRYYPTRLAFLEPLSFDEWAALGDSLNFINAGVQWWLGDWLRYGEGKFGERASQATTAHGYEYQTLANFAYVAGKFPVSRRRENLTWSHHAAVAALEPDEQDAVLDEAEKDELSVRDTASRAGAVQYVELARLQSRGGLELIIRRKRKPGEAA